MIRHRLGTGLAAALATIAFSIPSPPPVHAQATSCLVAVNKAGAKVAAAQGKNDHACIRDAGRGDLPLNGATQSCIDLDDSGKVGKIAGRVNKAFVKKCSPPPAFGITNNATVISTARGEQIRLVASIFGSPVDDAIIRSSDDPAGARCQESISRAYEKLAARFAKSFNSCKKSGLKSGAITDDAGLAACVGADDGGKVDRAAQKLAATAADRCGGIDLATAFPADCAAAATSAELADCVAARTLCHGCAMLNTMDGLAADCDTADDGDGGNGSCVIVAVCGDGILNAPEECDDGGESENCDDDCTPVACGDGNTNGAAGESCDDAGESTACDDNCTLSVCGDGLVNATAGETCDDGNLVDGDGCDTNCTPSACGNGVVVAGEECDDGNTDDGDGCTSTCTCESGSLALGCEDPQCPGRVDLTLAAGTGPGCSENADCTVGTCSPSLGRCVTASELDFGWTGLGHDQDWSDATVRSLRLSCTGPPTCGECVVRGVDPSAGNCRCNTDNQAVCSDPLSLSASDCSVGATCATDTDCRVCSGTTSTSCNSDDDCPGGEHCLAGSSAPTCVGGQCVGLCECFAGPPTPRSTGNAPSCSVHKLALDTTGTIDVDTGDQAIFVRLTKVVFLGEGTAFPCPACGGTCTAPAASLGTPCIFDGDCDVDPDDGTCGNFDTVANDGVRDGTCVLGGNDGEPCDAQGRNQSFPAPGGADVSLDCMPTGSKNVTGSGLQIELRQTTGTQSLGSEVECGFDVPGLPLETCPCGVCSGDSSLACTSDSACATAGAGTCGLLSQGKPRPNECNSGSCVDIGGGEGECDSTSGDKFCDGALLANGEPFAACLSDDDCDIVDCGPQSCGSCTIEKPRPCFLDPIEATGTPLADAPLSVAAYCVPPTSSAGVNSVMGLPGPAREKLQATAAYACAGDPGSSYTPGVGGCP